MRTSPPTESRGCDRVTAKPDLLAPTQHRDPGCAQWAVRQAGSAIGTAADARAAGPARRPGLSASLTNPRRPPSMKLDAAEGLYRLVDAAYEKRSVAVSSNLHPAAFDELMPKTLRIGSPPYGDVPPALAGTMSVVNRSESPRRAVRVAVTPTLASTFLGERAARTTHDGGTFPALRIHLPGLHPVAP